MRPQGKSVWMGLDWEEMKGVYRFVRHKQIWDTGMFKAFIKLDDTGHVVVEAIDDMGNILPPTHYPTLADIPDTDAQNKLKLLMWVDETDQHPRQGIGTRVGKHNFWIEK